MNYTVYYYSDSEIIAVCHYMDIVMAVDAFNNSMGFSKELIDNHTGAILAYINRADNECFSLLDIER